MTTMHTVALSSITPSKTNPRKTFEKAALAELADSVKRLGILQPVLVRPNGSSGSYELVAGERRYRAAKEAGLGSIPCTIRELSDAEALEIQVIENLQRQDLDPLEEADGYAALMKCAHPGGATYSADEIALKIGKSRAYVYARLKLGELCDAGRKLLADGTISASVAELVARVPGHKLQADALEGIAGRYGTPMSFKQAREYLQQNYMLRLADAPFDVKVLYYAKPKDVQPIKPCGECPKRTGNQPALFADVKSADVCTDPACFQDKKLAAARIKIEEHRAAGKTVITGADAKKLMPNTWSDPKGYVKLDGYCNEDPKGRHWQQLLGKAAPEVVLIEKPGAPGEFLEAYPEKEARAALAKKHPDLKKVARAESRGGNPEYAIAKAVRWKVHFALREIVKRKGFTNAELVEIGLAQIDYGGGIDEEVALAWGLPKECDDEVANAKLRAATGGDLLAMIFDLLLPAAYENHREAHDRLAELHGIDVKAFEREVRSEFKKK